MPNGIIVPLSEKCGGGYISPRRENYIIRTGSPKNIGDEAVIWTFEKRDGFLLPKVTEHHVMLLETMNGFRWLVEMPQKKKRRTRATSKTTKANG